MVVADAHARISSGQQEEHMHAIGGEAEAPAAGQGGGAELEAPPRAKARTCEPGVLSHTQTIEHDNHPCLAHNKEFIRRLHICPNNICGWVCIPSYTLSCTAGSRALQLPMSRGRATTAGRAGGVGRDGARATLGGNSSPDHQGNPRRSRAIYNPTTVATGAPAAAQLSAPANSPRPPLLPPGWELTPGGRVHNASLAQATVQPTAGVEVQPATPRTAAMPGTSALVASGSKAQHIVYPVAGVPLESADAGQALATPPSLQKHGFEDVQAAQALYQLRQAPVILPPQAHEHSLQAAAAQVSDHQKQPPALPPAQPITCHVGTAAVTDAAHEQDDRALAMDIEHPQLPAVAHAAGSVLCQTRTQPGLVSDEQLQGQPRVPQSSLSPEARLAGQHDQLALASAAVHQLARSAAAAGAVASATPTAHGTNKASASLQHPVSGEEMTLDMDLPHLPQAARLMMTPERQWGMQGPQSGLTTAAAVHSGSLPPLSIQNQPAPSRGTAPVLTRQQSPVAQVELLQNQRLLYPQAAQGADEVMPHACSADGRSASAGQKEAAQAEAHSAPDALVAYTSVQEAAATSLQSAPSTPSNVQQCLQGLDLPTPGTHCTGQAARPALQCCELPSAALEPALLPTVGASRATGDGQQGGGQLQPGYPPLHGIISQGGRGESWCTTESCPVAVSRESNTGHCPSETIGTCKPTPSPSPPCQCCADFWVPDLPAPIAFSSDFRLVPVVGSPENHHFWVFHPLLEQLGEVRREE
jgi:hypothetical protein